MSMTRRRRCMIVSPMLGAPLLADSVDAILDGRGDARRLKTEDGVTYAKKIEPVGGAHRLVTPCARDGSADPRPLAVPWRMV
jgi:hypothetical protein